MSNEDDFTIGDLVISPNFGIGIVVSTEFIESVGGDVYIVERKQDQSRLMIPKTLSNQIRRTVTPEQMKEALDSISKLEFAEREFDSRKDRVEYFKKQQKCIRINELCMAIVEMFEIPSKGKVESQIYEQMLEIFLSEVVEVTAMDYEQAKEKVESSLNSRT